MSTDAAKWLVSTLYVSMILFDSGLKPRGRVAPTHLSWPRNGDVKMGIVLFLIRIGKVT